MTKYFNLQDLTNDSLDAVLSLPLQQKSNYFVAMVKSFYPKIEESTPEFESLIASYISSFYVEKIYRSNRFFNEKFTPVYTKTGLIRNIIADMYFTNDDLITH